MTKDETYTFWQSLELRMVAQLAIRSLCELANGDNICAQVVVAALAKNIETINRMDELCGKLQTYDDHVIENVRRIASEKLNQKDTENAIKYISERVNYLASALAQSVER